MRINSSDATEYIEITRGSFDDPVDIDLQFEDKGFSGTNYNIFSMNIGVFLEDLVSLEASRSGKASLEGTEDFYITFKSDGHSGAIKIHFQIARYVGHSIPTGVGTFEYKISARFPVDGEHVGPITRGFQSMLKA